MKVKITYKGEDALLVITGMTYYAGRPQTRYQECIPEYIEIESGYVVTKEGEVSLDEVLKEAPNLPDMLLEAYKEEDAELKLDCQVGRLL